MKKLTKLIGTQNCRLCAIALAAVIGFSMAACAKKADDGGLTVTGLTITGLDNYNGKYLWAIGFDDDGRFLACVSTSYIDEDLNLTLSEISGGSVTTKIWYSKYNPNTNSYDTAAIYNGNDTIELSLSIVYESNGDTNWSSERAFTDIRSGKTTVTFKNGVASGAISLLGIYDAPKILEGDISVYLSDFAGYYAAIHGGIGMQLKADGTYGNGQAADLFMRFDDGPYEWRLGYRNNPEREGWDVRLYPVGVDVINEEDGRIIQTDKTKVRLVRGGRGEFSYDFMWMYQETTPSADDVYFVSFLQIVLGNSDGPLPLPRIGRVSNNKVEIFSYKSNSWTKENEDINLPSETSRVFAVGQSKIVVLLKNGNLDFGFEGGTLYQPDCVGVFYSMDMFPILTKNKYRNYEPTYSGGGQISSWSVNPDYDKNLGFECTGSFESTRYTGLITGGKVKFYDKMVYDPDEVKGKYTPALDFDLPRECNNVVGFVEGEVLYLGIVSENKFQCYWNDNGQWKREEKLDFTN
jgi:hypothetical protein